MKGLLKGLEGPIRQGLSGLQRFYQPFMGLPVKGCYDIFSFAGLLQVSGASGECQIHPPVPHPFYHLKHPQKLLMEYLSKIIPNGFLTQRVS